MKREETKKKLHDNAILVLVLAFTITVRVFWTTSMENCTWSTRMACWMVRCTFQSLHSSFITKIGGTFIVRSCSGGTSARKSWLKCVHTIEGSQVCLFPLPRSSPLRTWPLQAQHQQPSVPIGMLLCLIEVEHQESPRDTRPSRQSMHLDGSAELRCSEQ